MIVSGFYIIKDSFFKLINDPNIKLNKSGNRPHYYCFADEDGLFWMIPLSSQVEKYKQLIDKRVSINKPCDIIHIAKLDNGKESVFLIQDMFPVTEDYIERQYTIKGNHLKLTSEKTIMQVEKKAKRIKALIDKDIKYTPKQPNIKRIKNMLSK